MALRKQWLWLVIDMVMTHASKQCAASSLDLIRFVPKLLRDHSEVFVDETVVEQALVDYKAMLCEVERQLPVTNLSRAVDLVWHEHILDTVAYVCDSARLFVAYLHHDPEGRGWANYKEV